MITFATKLHILLIMIVVGFGLYMFLLYKEVRLFQEEIDEMKQDILILKGTDVKKVCTVTDKACKVISSEKDSMPEQLLADVVAIDEDDDDDDSVTSIEIKSILTNIHNVANVADAVDVVDADADADDDVIAPVAAQAAQAVASAPSTNHTSDSNLFALDLEELKSVKYDDLRNFLRKKGHNVKGNKSELIDKIREYAPVA